MFNEPGDYAISLRSNMPAPSPWAWHPRAGVRAQSTPEPRCILRYWMFFHLEAIDPPGADSAELFDDPLLPMRRVAAELAGVSTGGG